MTQRQVRLDDEQYQQLQVISEKSGAPLALLVRWAVGNWLRANKKGCKENLKNAKITLTFD